jgi:hypothetical protein
MIVKEDFEIVFRDRSDCEFLLAQVRFKGVEICEINKETGNDNMEVEMLCNDPLYNGLSIKFPLDDFFEVLAVAKAELIDL